MLNTKYNVGQRVEVKDAVNSFTGRAVKSTIGQITMTLGMTFRPDGGRPEPKYMVELETRYGVQGYQIPESYLVASE